MQIDYDSFELTEGGDILELSVAPVLFVNNDLSLEYPAQIGKFSKRSYEMLMDGQEKGYGSKAIIMLEIFCDEGQTVPNSIQIDAINYVLQNFERIESVILDKLPSVIEYCVEDLIETVRDEDKERTKEYLEYASDPSQILKTFVFTGMDVVREKFEGKACVAINFICNWDKEHGLAVLLCEDKILEVGGAGQFYDY